MGSRQGSLLEKNVERIFKLGGFKTNRNAFVKDYEIDVLIKYGSQTIIVQCKQYEKSYINVKDVIHQWASKNKEIKADAVVIAIFGQEATREEKALANKLGIVLWDEGDVDKLDDLVAENGIKARETLLEELGLNYEVYSKNLKEEFVKPFTTTEEISKDLSNKSKIENVKEKISYTPILSLKALLETIQEGFNIKKEEIYYYNLDGKEAVIIKDPEIKKEMLLSAKQEKAEYKKINPKLREVEDSAIKELAKKSKTKYYFSNLPLKLNREGIFKDSKKDVFNEVKAVFSDEINEEMDEIKNRYDPRLEGINNNIEDLNMEISHLAQEQNSCEGRWGYKGDTQSEKKRSKDRFESLGRKQEWKRVKISQLESKKEFLSDKMDEETGAVADKYEQMIEDSISEFEFKPEESDCLIKERKLLWLPNIVGEITINSGKKVSIEIDYDKIKKIGECFSCKNIFKKVEYINSCNVCGNIFCSEHSLECQKCKNKVCKDDSWSCNICKKHYCDKEKNIKCSDCGKMNCNDCVKECIICNKKYCEEHIKKCHTCKNSVCKEDSKNCPVCKNSTCPNCLTSCKGCKRKICKTDFETCPHCKNKVCTECIRMKRKFLVLKEKRCVFCLDKK